MYEIKLHRTVTKTMARIMKGDRKAAERIADEVKMLKENPKPAGVVKLTDEIFRIRVGEYRVIYAVFDYCDTVVVGKIGRRSEDTYKDLEQIAERTKAIVEQFHPKE